MKYIVVLADGMGDIPIPQLDNKTPLEYAATPNMDRLAAQAELGMVRTVPPGMAPGSDVANLSVLGYAPLKSYSGRSPLEALSVGVQMEDTDVIFRANLVTLTEEEPYRQKTILDHSSGEISTEDADILMDAVRQAFQSDILQFYTGTSYRHILVWQKGQVVDLEPPHDHLGCVIGDYLPKCDLLREMMEKSFSILNNHPLNLQRAAQGLNKANSLWFWGAGTKPSLENFQSKTGLQGIMISAVDLLKGIAVGADMTVAQVENATGGLHTNYEGKAQAAIDGLLKDGKDFAYVHVEAPDEMGHQGSAENKVLSIEYIDKRVIAPIVAAMQESETDFRLLLLPDHPTPITLRTHTTDPVPYLLYDSTQALGSASQFSEKTATQSGLMMPNGQSLMRRFLESERSMDNE